MFAVWLCLDSAYTTVESEKAVILYYVDKRGEHASRAIRSARL